MSEERNLSDIIHELEEQDFRLKSKSINPESLSFTETGEIQIGDETFQLGPDFLRYFKDIVIESVKALRPSKNEGLHLLMKFLELQESRPLERMAERSRMLIRDGVAAIGLQKRRLVNLTSKDVIDAVLDTINRLGLEEDCVINEFHNSHSHFSFYLSVLFPRKARVVKPHDKVVPGLEVSHAMTGDNSTRVLTLLKRQHAGEEILISPTEPGRRQRIKRLPSEPENHERMINGIRLLTKQAIQGFADYIHALKKRQKEQVNVKEALDGLAAERKIHKAEMEPINTAIEREEPKETKSVFSLIMGISHFATHDRILSASRRRSLKRLAGEMILEGSRRGRAKPE